MWLRRKDTDLFSEGFVCDDIRKPDEIQQRLETGRWVEQPPMWIQHRNGHIVFVTHPAHQRRLLQEGGMQVVGPPPEPEEKEKQTVKK